MSRLPRSDVLFVLVMVSLFGLCAIYDVNQVLTAISSMVPFRRKLNSTPQTTPPPVHISLPVKPARRKTSVAICALSKSKPDWQYIHDSSVYKLFLTGIHRTTQMQLSEYSIQVHIGVDTTDPFWSKYDNYHALILASARDFNLRVAVHHYPKKHRDHLPMNELMRDAARTGAEYLVRLNDDTEITSMAWLPLAVHQLLAYNPPNVGVVGPVCKEGKTSILTHDMVHRTHLDIFETYYPPQFHNWYVDDWISEVYGRDRTTKIPGWTVHHHIGPPRYNPIMVDKETLRKTIQDGNDRIQTYLSKRNVSRKLSQVNSRVGHPRGGVGWQGQHSEKIRAYCSRGRKTPAYVQELIYPKDSHLDIEARNDPSSDNTWQFLLSLHDPKIDKVVSNGILNWLFSIPGTYPSTTEVHTLCTALVNGQPLINCESGKIAIEIGSAVGMVSAYLARRGMRVFAMDPVLPNIERLEETRCMNGMRQCLEQNEDIDCHNHSNWGQFTPDNFVILHGAGGDKTNLKTKISSLAKNMAATNLKLGGSLGSKGEMWSGLVSILTVDDIISKTNVHIEVLHISVQGSEWSVLQGALHLISAGLVQNIIFMLYQNDASAEEQIAQSLKIQSFLQRFGFQFYNLDDCGRGPKGVAYGPPILLKEQEVVKYIKKKRHNGWHKMLLASKVRKLARVNNMKMIQPPNKDAWMKQVLAAWGGTGQGGAKGISHSDLEKILANPLLFNVWEHLQGFTGLSDSELWRRLAREGQLHFDAEHAIANPQSSRELAWYYSTSVSYLFANAIHPALDLNLQSKDAPVLDYSGGVGNNVIFWASNGIKSVYFGIGMMEYAFVKYRVQRMGLENMVTFLSPHQRNNSWKFDPTSIFSSNTYGTIVAMDVLEHIPRWQETVRYMVQSLRNGGKIIECSPFSTNTAASGTDKDLRVHVGLGKTSMAEAMGPSMRKIDNSRQMNSPKKDECQIVWKKVNFTQNSNTGNSTRPARTPPATASHSTPVMAAQ